ncbi:hypothetical protein BKA62DRAFT_740435 [Auriculariales sp. MPI-PUGE-AT-0066]|nr:hypothetical protein BKA62DRAFT_740435 [Auriculariales sp. MPI-PUGE-AT-0066]
MPVRLDTLPSVHTLSFLDPATFYITSCVCSRWRHAARSPVPLHGILAFARHSDRQVQQNLTNINVAGLRELDMLWRCFLVAAPLRRAGHRRERPYRVSTLNFRALVTRGADGRASDQSRIPRVYASDYAGLLVVSFTKGLYIYSLERLRLAKGRGSEPKLRIATLPFPEPFTSECLLDVCIAHQTSPEAQHFVLFAAFKPPAKYSHSKALVMKSDIYYTTSTSGHRRYPFAKVELTPMLQLDDKDYGTGNWLDRTTTVLLFDVNVDNSASSALIPYERYQVKAPTSSVIPEARPGIRPVPVNPTRLLWNMSPGKHRRQGGRVTSQNRSYPPDRGDDMAAVVDRESFLEWFSRLCWQPYFPILRTLDRNTHFGIEFRNERLMVVSSKLSHLGLSVQVTAIELALPADIKAAPCHVAALDTTNNPDREANGPILVAVCWMTRIFHYELQRDWLGTPDTRQTAHPRTLAVFRTVTQRPVVSFMHFYGGVSRTMRGLPCESAAMLVVAMEAGLVHVVNFALGSKPGWQKDWTVSPASKLKHGLDADFGWRSSWDVQPDGRLT